VYEEWSTKKNIWISCTAGELLAESLVFLLFAKYCFVEIRFWKRGTLDTLQGREHTDESS
jgi:hypothetical protein